MLRNPLLNRMAQRIKPWRTVGIAERDAASAAVSALEAVWSELLALAAGLILGTPTLSLLGAIGAAMLTPAGPIGILYPLRYVDAASLRLAHEIR